LDSRLVLSHSVEEQELAQKREELNRFQAELIERELYLEELQDRLRAFESRYLKRVGVLYAELDDWTAKLADLNAKIAGTAEATAAAAEARKQAEESYAAAHREAATAPASPPSLELTRLYRQIMKQIHPDLAADEADRAQRTRLSAEANAAFRRGDGEALLRILEEYKRSPESVKGQGRPADLQRIYRQIDQIIRRLAQIESEIAELISSDLALLMAKVENAAAVGRDLLAEMANDVANSIRLAQTEFETQSSKLRAS
jgi:hypothetical protein